MKVEIPHTCPSCASTLERINDQLFCRNPNCGESQIKKVEAFAKKMKIKGLGIKTIEKLGLMSIPDIYELEYEVVSDAIGEKLATKLIDEIEKSRHTTLDVFLSACSIYLIGQTIAKKLLPYITNPGDLSEEICIKAGIGEKARNSLMQWFTTEFSGYLEYLPITFIKGEVEDSKSCEITVCITGKTPGYTKSTLAKALLKRGIATSNSVSKNINYLICNERKNSSKEQKAISLNIPIISLEELFTVTGEK